MSVYVLCSNRLYMSWRLSILNLLAKTSFFYCLQTRGRYKTLVQVPIIYTSSGNWIANSIFFIFLNLLMICFSLMPFLQSQIETDGGKSLDFSNYPYIFMVWDYHKYKYLFIYKHFIFITISLMLHVEMERAILCQCWS